jgi:L-ascorbate metabolism protein UlaG (beta-lactamase superfamily)
VHTGHDFSMMQFTYYGHACFAVETGGQTLLFDPFITLNPLAKSIDASKVRADVILVSHGHNDHLADAVAIAQRTGAPVVAPYEVGNWLENQGIDNVQSINPGGTPEFKFGRVKMTAAIHSSSLPDGSYGGNPTGFLVMTNEGNFYYAGDTALTYDMKLVREWTKLDFAVLPIGGYFTMGIDDAIRAADFVGATKIIGVHYDTFPPIQIDHDEAQGRARQAGKELLLLKVGETIEL